MDRSDNNISKRNPLRRSMSSFGFNTVNSSMGLREAKSFTGALQELRNGNKHEERDSNYYLKIFTERQSQSTKDIERITKEVSSDTIFVVRYEMLNYRGKQYSMADIASRWKKDCRMWLWKGTLQRRNKSVSDIREKMQSLRMPSSTEAFQRIL